jgi:hypothetical protein
MVRFAITTWVCNCGSPALAVRCAKRGRHHPIGCDLLPPPWPRRARNASASNGETASATASSWASAIASASSGSASAPRDTDRLGRRERQIEAGHRLWSARADNPRDATAAILSGQHRPEIVPHPRPRPGRGWRQLRPASSPAVPPGGSSTRPPPRPYKTGSTPPGRPTACRSTTSRSSGSGGKAPLGPGPDRPDHPGIAAQHHTGLRGRQADNPVRYTARAGPTATRSWRTSSATAPARTSNADRPSEVVATSATSGHSRLRRRRPRRRAVRTASHAGPPAPGQADPVAARRHTRRWPRNTRRAAQPRRRPTPPPASPTGPNIDRPPQPAARPARIASWAHSSPAATDTSAPSSRSWSSR